MLLTNEMLIALGEAVGRDILSDDEKIYTHLKKVCGDIDKQIAKIKAIDEALKIIDEGLNSEAVIEVFEEAEVNEVEETEELNLFSIRTDSVAKELEKARQFVIDEEVVEVKASNKTTKDLADYIGLSHSKIMRKTEACIKNLNTKMSQKKIYKNYFIHSTYNNNRYKCFELTKEGIEELAYKFLGDNVDSYRKIKKFISEFYKDEVAVNKHYSSVNEVNDYYNKAYGDLIKEAIDIVKYLDYVKKLYKHNDTIRNVLQDYNEYYLGKISISDFLNPMFIESYRDILNDIITDNISDELIDTVATLEEIKKLNINRPVLVSFLHNYYKDVYEMFYNDKVSSGQFLVA